MKVIVTENASQNDEKICLKFKFKHFDNKAHHLHYSSFHYRPFDNKYDHIVQWIIAKNINKELKKFFKFKNDSTRVQIGTQEHMLLLAFNKGLLRR